MDLLCGKGVCDKKPPWQGLELYQTFCAKRKSKFQKESTFFQEMWQLDINSEFSITVAEDEVTEYDSSSDEDIYEAEDLMEAEEGTNDLGNQQITKKSG